MHDDLDRRLLRLWQSDPELTIAELAVLAGINQAKAQRRLTRLEETGSLKGREAVIDWAVLGYSAQVSLRITLDKTQTRAFDEFIDEARKIPEVIEIQTFLGRVDVRLSIIARDMAHYQDIYRGRVLTLPHMADIEALMTISTVKRDEALPL